VAVAAFGCHYFKTVQNVEARLFVMFLFCVVASKLTEGCQTFLIHSPFPTNHSAGVKLTLMKESSRRKNQNFASKLSITSVKIEQKIAAFAVPTCTQQERLLMGKNFLE
jgi:hypothetical protein